MNEKQARRIVRERSGDLCELRIPGVCFGTGTNYQHRKRKGHCTAEERWSPVNGLWVCGSGTTGCHGYIHRNPAIATDEGWEVKSWDHPAVRPVKLWQGYALLDDAGGWTNLGHEKPILEHSAGCSVWTVDLCDCGGVA